MIYDLASAPQSKPSAGLDAPNRTPAGTITGWGVAIVLSALTGWFDFRLNDISVSLFVVLAVAMLLGVIWRERAWRWGLVSGAALPAAHLLWETWLRQGPAAHSLVLLTAFIPSLVGAYMGAFLNKMVSALLGHEDRTNT